MFIVLLPSSQGTVIFSLLKVSVFPTAPEGTVTLSDVKNRKCLRYLRPLKCIELCFHRSFHSSTHTFNSVTLWEGLTCFLQETKQPDMQTDKEEDEDASPEEYVALSDFTGSGSDQVRDHTDMKPRRVGVLALTVSPLFHSLSLAAVTNCLCTPSRPQTGGGQSCRGSQVMSLRATCIPTVLRRRRTPPCRTHGRMKNTLAVMGHWLETCFEFTWMNFIYFVALQLLQQL